MKLNNISSLRTTPIGETACITINSKDVWVKVCRGDIDNPCKTCALYEVCEDTRICTKSYRDDYKEVYFKRIK